jgi:hypothetical protein
MNLHLTFFHKLILCIVFGACAAGLFEFYKEFIIGADKAVNGGYNERYGISVKR